MRYYAMALIILVTTAIGCSNTNLASVTSTNSAPITSVAQTNEENTYENVCITDADGNYVSCPTDLTNIEHSSRGASERYHNNTTRERDLQFFLTTTRNYKSDIQPVIGVSKLMGGGHMYAYGLYVDPAKAYPFTASWQQEWITNTNAYLSEQILLFDSSDTAQKFMSLWRTGIQGAGIQSLLVSDPIENSITIAYIDPLHPDINRRCIAQTATVTLNMFVATNYLAGGDCYAMPIDVPTKILKTTLKRITTLTQ